MAGAAEICPARGVEQEVKVVANAVAKIPASSWRKQVMREIEIIILFFETTLSFSINDIKFCQRRPRAIGVTTQGDEFDELRADRRLEFYRFEFCVLRKDALRHRLAPSLAIGTGIKSEILNPPVLIVVLTWQCSETGELSVSIKFNHQRS